MSNALGSASSPYLRQHRDNPVDWLQWGDDAFARAASEDKPILLSIGYAACHWCHVMAHESFENEATARLMNEKFVCVKVDREERPDLDQVYQTALAAIGGQGGWPLTMFLDNNGTPFWGGTYFPPESKWGRPGFPEVLERIFEIFRDSPDKVRESARDMGAAMLAMAQPESPPAPELSPAFLDRAAAALLPAMDPLHGGTQGAPKFPQPSLLELLWRAHLRTEDAALGNAAVLTLDRMCQGGIYDHLGGGFARYSVDDAWLVPHFEKMLYDNALLLALLTRAWRSTESPLYAARIEETVVWLLRDVVNDDGAFTSSLDADSEGEEGRYYVWTEPEIDSLLGHDSGTFKEAYGVDAAGNWEGRTILNRTERPIFGDAAHEAGLARAREVLLEARAKRVPPLRDDKVLADWNGLLIAALADAAGAFERADWLDAARRAFDAVVRFHSLGPKLRHSSCDGDVSEVGFLDDYAAMALAAIALEEATGDSAYLAQAEAWMGELEHSFGDPDRGGYFYAAEDGDRRLLVRPRHARDSAQPSGNALAAEALARLAHRTGSDAARIKAESIFQAFAGDAARNATALAGLLNAYDVLSGATQVTVIGRRGEADADALVAAAYALPTASRVLQVVAPGAQLNSQHPAAGKSAIDGHATAYVCLGSVCAAPAADPDQLRVAWESLQ
jgi:uncharacterized protein YyaL (SSP411 family)